MRLKRKSVALGALILTAASLTTRLLGFVYRIYMTKTIGAEGMGLYQLIVPIYSLCWSLTCAGITTTVSKLVAAENAKREYGNMGRILKQALFLTCTISAVVSVLLFTLSPFIAESFLKDARTLPSLRMLSFAIVFMAAGSCIRGYFFGLQEQKVPAISQVLEQCVRMALIFALAGSFMSKGLEYACLAAVMGIVAGEVIAFLYVLVSYRFFKKKNGLMKKPSMQTGESLALIISMALPLSMNKIANSLLTTLENVLIPQRLQLFGMSSNEAISLFGKVSGMALPLIFFPSAILVSLSIAIVPAISEALAVNNRSRMASSISKALMFTSVTGVFACMLFMVVPDELGQVIYGQDIGEILFILGIMSPLLYMNITMSGILNGLGQQLFIFKMSLLSSLITISFVYFLVPLYGIAVFVAGWMTSLLIVTSLSIIRIHKQTRIKISFLRWFVKPGIAALASGLITEVVTNRFVAVSVGKAFGLVISVSLMAALYICFIFLLGCITVKDVKTMFKRNSKNVDPERKNGIEVLG